MTHASTFRRLLLAACAAMTIGCNRSSDDKVRVAFVTNNPHEFWTYAERGCEKGAKDFGVEVLFRRPPQGSPAEQQEIVEKLVLMGVKGIAVSPCDAKNQTVFYDKIAEQIPLVTQDSDLPVGSKRVCYLGTDNYGAGKAAGKMIKETMPDGGKVVVLVGSLDAQNAQERRQGVLDELADAKDAQGPTLGKYELVNTYTDDGKQDVCKTKVDNVLVSYLSDSKNDPARLCFVGLWAYNPPAALEAAKSAGVAGKVKIVGFDEHEQTLAGIQSGAVHGTVVQSPFEFGYEAARILAGLAKGDKSVLPSGGVKFIPHQVVKQPDVAAFQAKLKQLLGK
ncbi:MAG: sugar-binding protein [Planctomycetia bacterium]|nr:sugar-binding protein [Planctomycetia bacterium]